LKTADSHISHMAFLLTYDRFELGNVCGNIEIFLMCSCVFFCVCSKFVKM